MRNILNDLQAAAGQRDATVVDRGNGHYQIVGRLLVNYYPTSKRRTAYVDGTTHGRQQVSPTEAVNMAFEAPPLAADHEKDTRSKNARAQRKKLIAKHGPHCHWCSVFVTLNNSTIDHVIPISRGGLDNANNRVLSCAPCNRDRANDMPELKGEK